MREVVKHVDSDYRSTKHPSKLKHFLIKIKFETREYIFLWKLTKIQRESYKKKKIKNVFKNVWNFPKVIYYKRNIFLLKICFYFNLNLIY